MNRIESDAHSLRNAHEQTGVHRRDEPSRNSNVECQQRDNKNNRNGPKSDGVDVGQKAAIWLVSQSGRDVRKPLTDAFNPKVAGSIPARPITELAYA